jgi:hypothetical protein
LMTSRLRPDVSATPGPSTLTGERLLTLCELLFKYSPSHLVTKGQPCRSYNREASAA